MKISKLIWCMARSVSHLGIQSSILLPNRLLVKQEIRVKVQRTLLFQTLRLIMQSSTSCTHNFSVVQISWMLAVSSFLCERLMSCQNFVVAVYVMENRLPYTQFMKYHTMKSIFDDLVTEIPNAAYHISILKPVWERDFESLMWCNHGTM
jgi:hypothetical protein